MQDIENQRHQPDKSNTYTAFNQEESTNPVYGQRTSLEGAFHAENRNNFVKKVYSILVVQLLITVAVSAISMTNKQFLYFQYTNMWLFYVSIVASIAIMLILTCVPSVGRQVPHNYLLLGSFTLFEAYMVSFFCGLSAGDVVFMAAAMTLGIVLALTYYAMTTDSDFTLQGGMLYILGMTLMLMMMFNWFFESPLMHILISAGAALLFSVYIVYDTQLIVGGKRAEIEIDDYILGALMLYSDIIGLFLQLLSLLNAFVNGDSR